MSIAIVDYGMGNLKNVQKAFESLGVEAIITNDHEVIRQSEKVVLPGVGAFRDAIATICETGIKEVLDACIAEGKPFLGVCLGMQLLFEESYENGHYKGLNYIPGRIIPIETDLKVPHMGWNTLEIVKPKDLLKDIPQESYVYFVHSYHLDGADEYVTAYTTYGKRFGVMVQKDHIYGAQFHPEKSSTIGLKMLAAFAAL